MDRMEKQLEWVAKGQCKINNVDTNLFFPKRGSTLQVEEAKAVCAKCVVADECLDYALVNYIKYGIWGGTSERQRRALRRTRNVPPPMYYDPVFDNWVLSDNRRYIKVD